VTKQEFLQALTARLSGAPEKELNEALAYYEEMIDDRIEDGMNEEDAVHAIGTLDDAVAQVIADTPLLKLARERTKPKRRLSVFEIVLLSLGSPIWISLAAAAIAVFLSLYVVLWTLVAVAWIVGTSFALTALACVIATVPVIFEGNVGVALFFLGSGMALAGLAIFTYFGALAATRGTLRLSKWIWTGTKRALVRKEKTV
jgi:uncharacterized membrane protein